jgi:hypothetical protein
MAGSRTIRQYTADDGTNYAIAADKSNADANLVGRNTVLLATRQLNVPDLPRGLRPRYVLTFLKSDPTVKRKFYVGVIGQIGTIYTPGAIIEGERSPTGIPGGGTKVQWIVTAYRGEKYNFRAAVDAFDSGQTDGNVLVQ